MTVSVPDEKPSARCQDTYSGVGELDSMNTAVTIQAACAMRGAEREPAGRDWGTAVSDMSALLVRVFSNYSLVRKNSYRVICLRT
ncbi:Uncharacterised protein [Burkholderia cepacia]|uniref:Uncharacterized protein n=1 Tax=Burkholderia cepacia TaxID=292 RepID=A0AAE8NE43_BURCE|nr:Uncharacterised protein [Burkholderia cepacia]